MVQVSKATGLSETMIRQAADWYRQNAIPVAFRKISPAVLREVKRLSGGDWRRCEVDGLGRVTIHNHPVWTPSGR